MSVKKFHCSKVMKRSRMKVRLTLNGFLLGVLLVSYAEAGVIEISAYGNVSTQRTATHRNSSYERDGREMNNGGFGSIFEGMLTRPINFGASRSRDSNSTKYIVYSGNSHPVDSEEQVNDATPSNRSTSEESYNGAIYKILKKEQENPKEYQYQQHNATTNKDFKPNLPSSPPPAPSPSPAPPTVTIPEISVIAQNSDDHDESSPATEPAPLAEMPLEHGTGRVKAYSYFYLSRTLWYVPLYFTLYFCFYILILVIRSIARHKVTYPNNFTGRSKAVQDMQFITNDQAVQKADMLTTFVMKQIDDFKEKYIG